MRRSRRLASRTSEPRKQVASIRTILDERRVNGHVEYLLACNDKITGEPLPSAWSREVTDQAKEEWDNSKASCSEKQVDRDIQHGGDSQPPRPSNWRRLQRTQTLGASDAIRSRQDRRRQRDGSEFDDDESERLCKVAKVARSPTISQEPDSSVASLSCADSVVHNTSEIDSPGDLDQGDLNPAGNQRLMIQLPKKPLFDPAEYSSQHNTQASGLSSQSIAELESQDDCLFVASQLSRQTIPDSQELSGQTWSVDLQSSAHSARETWISSQVDHRHYPTVKLQQNELHPGTSRSSCLLEARTHSIGHSSASELSNCPDIPSHQPHQPKSLSGTTQDFHLTAFADELNFEASTPGIGSELSIVPDSNAAPAFLSQPPLPFSFPIPESSSSVLQGSPDASVVDESISNLVQVSASASSAADNLTESQDAQILPITPFVSHVSAFTVSHDTEQGGNPLVTPQQASTELSQPSTSVSVVTHDKMDSSRAARTPSKPAWLSSAVDELSQIFALDDDSDDIAEDPDSPDFKTALAEAVANSRKAESFGPDVQESQARQQQSQPYSLVAKSEQAKFKSPPKSPPSAVQSLQGMVDMIFRRPDLPVSDPILPDATQHEGPSTVSLADISNSQKLTSSLLTQEELSSVGLPRSEYHSSAAAASVHMSSLEPDDESDDESDDDDDDDDSDSSSSQEAIALKHTVTIPFQASIRPLYDDTLLEYKKEIQQYGNVFSSEEYIEPDEALVRKIDQVLDGLRNLCDYPPDVIGSAIETLPSNQLIKYCCDGNGKFNFLFELLQGLTKDTRILIVARSVELLKLLYRLAEALGIECICGDLGSSFKPETGISISRITLILPERDVDEDDFDLVIGYDYSFGSSVVGLRLEPEIPGARSPMVLTLVTTHSIEHIDLHVPGDLTLLERKNALVSGIVRARQLVKDPDRGCPEPYEVASLFVEYLNGLAEDVIWEPIPLPEDILDIYLHSQSRSQIPATDAPEVLDIVRKRKLDDQDDSDNDGAKRPRISFSKQPTVGADNAPVPDDVRALLDSVKPKSMDSTAATPLTGVVSVPVAVLQALAEQVSELRRQVDTADTNTPYKNLISALDARIKEYERTSAKIYSSHRAALEDRATFERQAQKAEAALQTTKDATQKLTEKSQKKIADLEATVTRLTAGPDASKETPLSKTQKLLQEAQEKAQTLEKRLEIALKDADYARSLYQDVTATSGALRGENASLKEQVTDLARKTEDTLGKVHAIQADTAIKHHLVQISDLKSQLRERDLELEHTKDELRLLKRARRETRQVSVPRSPRLGMMSPRTGRVSHGGAGEGASASRGGSPANARWKNHLRD